MKWASDNNVDWHYIDPGKLHQNGFIESFNGSLLDELLNEEIFDTLDDACGKLALRLQQRQATLETGREDPRRDRRRTCLGACPQTRCHPIKHQS